ncbi:hypothetical protein F1880_002030 [Penicillium rolfsii]|nr:hypothetical protein F1880_002030 [Penicillium rolfsii]
MPANMDPQTPSKTDPVNFELGTPSMKDSVAPEPTTMTQDSFGDESYETIEERDRYSCGWHRLYLHGLNDWYSQKPLHANPQYSRCRDILFG